MRYILLFLAFFQFSHAQLKITSWNLKNFGKSKSSEDIDFIAETLKNSDIIAIQEVVAGYGGTQAVAKLASRLDKTGANWDYVISSPTNSSPYKSERYAYLWKKHKVAVKGRAFLDNYYKHNIEREPYIMHFNYKDNFFTLVNFHAIPKKQQPEREIKFLKFFPDKYPSYSLIFLGDFNCPETHSVFNPLKKMGYTAAFTNQKTTLRQQCINGDCLASSFDNFYINTRNVHLLKTEIIPFYQSFDHIKTARLLSDHLPITIEIDF